MQLNEVNKEFFKNPTTDPDYSISGFWFWNDLITDDKTTEQLEMMKRIHANQPVVHSRSGLINEYLSEDWFDRIAHVIDLCKKNEQKIWLYDENNWPSGNCSWSITKDERYREHFLQFKKHSLQVGEQYIVDTSLKEFINITAYASNVTIDLLKEIEPLFIAELPTEIYEVYICVDAYEPVGKFNVDYLSKKALQLFIDSTHEKYREHFGEEFGNIITGIFMDETRFCNAIPWTNKLPEEFMKRKGYALLPYLPLLVRKTELSNKVRFDYYDVISDLYTEATFAQIYDWCEQYQMKTIGHFLGEETIATQSYFGADMMRGYQYFHVPGIDHLGNGIGSLDGKFAVSACHNYGKTRIACEAFGASGWDMNYEDMVRISNWLFQQGINLIIMHGFYYSIRDERSNDFPPSYFYQWKYWDHMPTYVKMANRMMEMLSNGCHEADLLVYTPIETFWNYFEPDLNTKTGFWEEGPWIGNDQAKFIDNQFQLLCHKLLDKNLDFDIFHADAVHNFTVKGDKLVNLLTGEEFSVFVLPLTELLTADVIQLLNAFTKAGGRVISYRSDVVDIVCKNGDHMRNDKPLLLETSPFIEAKSINQVAEQCMLFTNPPYKIICGVDEIAHSKPSYPARLIDPYIHDGERVYGVGVTRYLKEGNRIINFTNYNDKEEDIIVWVASKELPELFIPETGEIILIENAIPEDEGFTISFTIPKNRSYFIVCGC